MSQDPPNPVIIDPSALSICVVSASFNPALTNALLDRVTQCMEANGALNQLFVERVPGSHEIPSCIDLILQKMNFDCLVALGVVIKGGTSHHHLVAESTGHSLQSLSLQYHTPIINGIVVTDDIKSAEDRIIGNIDRGMEFANAALSMAQLKQKWTKI